MRLEAPALAGGPRELQVDVGDEERVWNTGKPVVPSPRPSASITTAAFVFRPSSRRRWSGARIAIACSRAIRQISCVVGPSGTRSAWAAFHASRISATDAEVGALIAVGTSPTRTVAIVPSLVRSRGS